MVLCFVALFVFAVLGIFSAKYRSLAKEAFGCVFNTFTLRPCESHLDERIKSTIIGKALSISPGIAKALHKHYKWVSIAFTVLFFASMAYSAVSVYNYWAFGNCNGPDSSAFCVFDSLAGKNPSALKAVAPGAGPILGNGSVSMVEFGCFTCPYTRAAQPAVKAFLTGHPEVNLEFRAFPLPTHNNSFLSAQAAFCALDRGVFWQYYAALYEMKDHSRESLAMTAERLGLDKAAFNACLSSASSAQRVQSDIDAGKAAGIYGTPTFYLNGIPLVGPQTKEAFESALKGIAQVGAVQHNASCPAPVA